MKLNPLIKSQEAVARTILLNELEKDNKFISKEIRDAEIERRQSIRDYYYYRGIRPHS